MAVRAVRWPRPAPQSSPGSFAASRDRTRPATRPHRDLREPAADTGRGPTSGGPHTPAADIRTLRSCTIRGCNARRRVRPATRQGDARGSGRQARSCRSMPPMARRRRPPGHGPTLDPLIASFGQMAMARAVGHRQSVAPPRRAGFAAPLRPATQATRAASWWRSALAPPAGLAVAVLTGATRRPFVTTPDHRAVRHSFSALDCLRGACSWHSLHASAPALEVALDW